MTDWYRQGREADSLPLGDRSMLYGDGAFETIALRNGQPRLWDMHIERLTAACDRLGFAGPAAPDIEREMRFALSATRCDLGFATAKVIVTAGVGPRGYRRPEPPQTDMYIGVSEAQPLHGSAYRDGVHTRVCETRIAVQPRVAGLKTLNRLDQVLARQEWAGTEHWEGLMFDIDDHLICGTMTNVFLVHDNAISTPRLDRSGVAGIMRRHVMAVLAAESTNVAEKALTTVDLETAAEVFLTNSQVGVVPVASIADRTIRPGPATRRVMQRLAINGVPECAP